jgi:hypothetical protein
MIFCIAGYYIIDRFKRYFGIVMIESKRILSRGSAFFPGYP